MVCPSSSYQNWLFDGRTIRPNLTAINKKTTAPMARKVNMKENYIEIVGCILALLAMSPFVAYLLAKADVFFTFLESGDIKFIMHGETLHKIIFDVQGFKLVDGKFEPTTIAEEADKKRPWFGFYWVGIPFLSSIHNFPITKERENPAGKTPEEWIERDPGEKTVSSLRFTLPRPYVLRDVELKDRTPIDVLVVAKFQVVNPYIPVFLFKGKFFENAGGIIRASISDILTRFLLDEFVKAEKGEVGGILAEMKEPENALDPKKGKFNQELIKQVGLRLVGISIPQYDPSDNTLRLAMNAQIIAEEQAKGKVAEATGHANQLAIRVEAEAKAAERLAVSRGARVKETLTQLKASGATGDVLAKATADILRAESLAGPDSKITTLVDGNASAVVPVGGNKP